jgi:hypothetical protein
MFIAAFEKEAGPTLRGFTGLGHAFGRPIGAVLERGGGIRKAVAKGTRDFGKGFVHGLTPNRPGAWNGSKDLPAKGTLTRMNPGAKLTARRSEKELKRLAEKGPVSDAAKDQLHRNVSTQTERQLHERAGKIEAARAKAKRGPSFAERHPFITAGGTLLAAKHLLSEKKEESPQPMIPQGY